MSALHTLPRLPENLHQTGNCAALYRAAEYEMAAFVTAVRKTSGNHAAQRAGRYWLEELNRLNLQHTLTPQPDWRSVSIHAASRLASGKKPCTLFRWPGCSAHANNSATNEDAGANSGLANKLRRGVDSLFIWSEALIVYATKDLILLLLSL